MNTNGKPKSPERFAQPERPRRALKLNHAKPSAAEVPVLDASEAFANDETSTMVLLCEERGTIAHTRLYIEQSDLTGGMFIICKKARLTRDGQLKITGMTFSFREFHGMLDEYARVRHMVADVLDRKYNFSDLADALRSRSEP